MSDEDIIRELTLHGWHERDARTVIATVSPSRTLALILLMIAVIAAAAAAGFWYASNVSTEGSPANAVVTTPVDVPEGKGCVQDSDCGLLTCSGCYNEEFIAAAPLDLACTIYEGYGCACQAGVCIEVAPQVPVDTNTSNDAVAVRYDFPEATTLEACEAFGATWVRVGRGWRCELAASDAGKTCMTALDCQRVCLIDRTLDTEGTCTAYTPGNCYSFLTDQGLPQAVCVD